MTITDPEASVKWRHLVSLLRFRRCPILKEKKAGLIPSRTVPPHAIVERIVWNLGQAFLTQEIS